jgi:hypothetical protein
LLHVLNKLKFRTGLTKNGNPKQGSQMTVSNTTWMKFTTCNDLQVCGSERALSHHSRFEETSKSCGIFMSKYLICTVKILSLEPHEGVPLELAQFIAFPHGAAPNKGECAKGLLL